MQQQQAAVNESAAYLEKARLDQEQTQIRAPFAGRVISNEVAKGDRVIAGTALIQIADSNGLEVRVSVPAQIASDLNETFAGNQHVLATAELDGHPFVFELDRLSADIKSGQSGIDAFFRSRDGAAMDIGRVVSLTIRFPEEHDVIPMPVHALYENQTLFRVEESRLKAVRYETAGDFLDENGNFKVLIHAPSLKSGDTIMVSQLPRAITGLLVESIEVATASLDVSGP